MLSYIVCVPLCGYSMRVGAGVRSLTKRPSDIIPLMEKALLQVLVARLP